MKRTPRPNGYPAAMVSAAHETSAKGLGDGVDAVAAASAATASATKYIALLVMQVLYQISALTGGSGVPPLQMIIFTPNHFTSTVTL